MHPRSFLRTSPRRHARHWPLATLCATTVLLQACGGSDDDPSAPPPTAPPAVAVSGVVADGPLQGASVCYDLNDNGTCDSGEPGALTDADGKYSFEVDAAAAGQHAVLAQVPATAVDKDTGAAVGAAFQLRAPATGSTGAQAVFVSPLTTVVADAANSSGISVAEATAQVQARLGLSASPMTDFTAAGAASDVGLAARAVGRVVIDTARLAAEAGVDAAQAARLVREAAGNQLPVLAAALEANPAGTPAERIAAAAAAVASQLNLSASTVKDVADVVARPTGTADSAGPFVSVRRFAYTDANNYSWQLFAGDSSQTDASGAFTAHEPRANVSNGQDIAFSRNQLYWTGSTWHACDNGHAVVATVAATASRPQTSLYCGAARSTSRPVWEDISGKTLREVITRMRAYPLRDSPGTTTSADGLPVKWGPDPALLPADATFPEGSRYNTRQTTNNIGHTDRIELAVRPTVRWADGVFRQATTLEGLGVMDGNLKDAAAVPSGSNTLFVADVPLAAAADATLQAVQRWRLAVDVAALSGRFYRCDVLAANNSSQNCVATGDATLALQTQGDIRLLRVATGYPAVLKDKLAQQRFWAEHVGTVFRGTTDLERTWSDQRLNQPAWDALGAALGLPPLQVPAAPEAPGLFTTLRNFSFTDSLNYSWRLFTGDQRLLDANGNYAALEARRQLSAGTEVPFVRNRTYWTGSAWVPCADSGPVVTARPTAPFTSVYCQAFVDDRVANQTVQLGGRLMSDVVNEIRSYASTDNGSSASTWGPAVSAAPALSATRFPAGATLDIRGLRTVSLPESIATADTDRLRLAPAPQTSEPFADWPLATSLEQVIAGYPGGLASNVVNGATTLFVHRFTEQPSDPAYTNQKEIRVAFDTNGSKARFTVSNRLASNGFSTNYQTLLDTTYTIEQLGEARLLKFAAMPEGFERDFRFTRRYAERGGFVWYGWQDVRADQQVNWSQRLNGTAWDALRTTLGIQ